jgi:hypothetical protein
LVYHTQPLKIKKHRTQNNPLTLQCYNRMCQMPTQLIP